MSRNDCPLRQSGLPEPASSSFIQKQKKINVFTYKKSENTLVSNVDILWHYHSSCFQWVNANSLILLALCITTLLTVATLWGSANSTLPRVNYIKAVDVYLLTSFVFVLCTLIEYVLVLNCEHIRFRRRKKKDTRQEVCIHEAWRRCSLHFASKKC